MSDSTDLESWLGGARPEPGQSHRNPGAADIAQQAADAASAEFAAMFRSTPNGQLVCNVCGQRAYPGASILRRCMHGHWKCLGCGRMVPLELDGTKPRSHRNCRGAKGMRGVPVVDLPPVKAGDTYSTEVEPGRFRVYRYSGHGWWRISG